jgi:hypothetical protein
MTGSANNLLIIAKHLETLGEDPEVSKAVRRFEMMVAFEEKKANPIRREEASPSSDKAIPSRYTAMELETLAREQDAMFFGLPYRDAITDEEQKKRAAMSIDEWQAYKNELEKSELKKTSDLESKEPDARAKSKAPLSAPRLP